jgi:hypothetical protein
MTIRIVLATIVIPQVYVPIINSVVVVFGRSISLEIAKVIKTVEGLSILQFICQSTVPILPWGAATYCE